MVSVEEIYSMAANDRQDWDVLDSARLGVDVVEGYDIPTTFLGQSLSSCKFFAIVMFIVIMVVIGLLYVRTATWFWILLIGTIVGAMVMIFAFPN